MAGAKKSKNSRTVTTPGQQNLQLTGDAKLVISTNGGKNAYIRNVTNGQNPNLATDSEAFAAVVRTNTEAGLGARQRAEFAGLAQTSDVWAATLDRLEAAGVFA